MPKLTTLGQTKRTITQSTPKTGRKPKNELTHEVQRTLNEAAVYAVKLVRDAIRGRDIKGHKVQPISGTKAKLCELAISHAIGMPRQKIDIKHTGDMLTLADLAKMAREHELGKFKTLEDTKELAATEGGNEQN